MKRRFLILMFLLVLSGCQTTTTLSTTNTTTSSIPPTTTTTTTTTITTTLPTVLNMTLQNGVLTWSEVANATSYSLTLVVEQIPFPESEIIVNEPSYTLVDVPFGNLTVIIQAFNENTPISTPTEFRFVYHPLLVAPSIISIENGMLKWNAVQHATGYTIYLGSHPAVSVLAETLEVEIDSLLDPLLEYSITIVTKFQSWESPPSQPILYSRTFEHIQTINFTFSKADGQTFMYDFQNLELEILQLEGNLELSEEDYTFEEGVLTILQSFFDTLEYGEYQVLIYANIGLIHLNIQIVDTRKPYMVSSSQIYVSLGQSATLEFVLYDGEIGSVSGNDITEEDYTIEGSTLIINGEYIQRIFTRDPERTVLILGYTLTANQHITIGYLFIRIQPSS